MKNFVFCGFGKLGSICLAKLCEENYKPLAVLTHKDLGESAVDLYAEQKQIPFYYSDLRKDSSLLSELENLSFEYLISVNYRYIIPQSLLNRAKFPLNLHGSLLPRYRGRTPHVWAIINGEKKTGVTCHVMEATVDTGPIYKQIELNIEDDDTGADVLEKFHPLYPICLIESLSKIAKGISPTPQDHSLATYFGKRTPDMGYIDINRDIHSIIDFIRAQARPYPGAYFYLSDGQKLIAHKARILEICNVMNVEVGTVFFNGSGFVLNVSKGRILITEYEVQ
ncbi:methionyl-tRNA formyltransferase [Leptospira sp. 201903070]|uniref:Methionyl-tRNA formyltransferase n=1 Tax=Leptospira ainlahdjerensis TaxID=2810033 RepID=A0ABS2UC12_9LEPT|nr:methionyl-tRNA formyltransferase [Leptospira ainlahdjerensis]MBM9577339.1 methionyl-tRNA formyltransferase [Leptospira ainlahdjerensis]